MNSKTYRTHNDLFGFLKWYNHIDYCEIGIGPDGTIYELVCTSHQDMLVHIAYGKHFWEMEEEEVNRIYSEMENFDPLEFLCGKTGCIAVWYYGITIPRQGITDDQFRVIRSLYEHKKISVEMKHKNDLSSGRVGYGKIGR